MPANLIEGDPADPSGAMLFRGDEHVATGQLPDMAAIAGGWDAATFEQARIRLRPDGPALGPREIALIQRIHRADG